MVSFLFLSPEGEHFAVSDRALIDDAASRRSRQEFSLSLSLFPDADRNPRDCFRAQIRTSCVSVYLSPSSLSRSLSRYALSHMKSHGRRLVMSRPYS